MQDEKIPIRQLINIAHLAGEAILNIYNSDKEFEIESKADDSPLTRADQASNNIICEGLESLEIQYPIISEENKLVDYDIRKSFIRFWLIDPLDGTKEFIKRNDEFTVNIALIENGIPLAAVVYAPVLDEMYWAEKSNGAYMIKAGYEKQIYANTFQTIEPGLRVVCSRSHLNKETQEFIDGLIEPEKVSKGSSLKFLMLANGKAELYPRIAPTMEWDTAAAQCILEAAGGSVIEYETKNPLEYNKESLLNPFFIAMANRTY